MSERDEFEAWVNNPHLSDKSTEPGCVGEYTQPWTTGAWKAWQAARQSSKAEVAPYVVGNSYQMQNGEWVRFVKVHNEGTIYETMEDEAGVNRYTNHPSDYGRVTGSPHGYSDPRNTPPLYSQHPARVPDELAEWYEHLKSDYVRYSSGDPTLPFSTFRQCLDQFMAVADRALLKQEGRER